MTGGRGGLTFWVTGSRNDGLLAAGPVDVVIADYRVPCGCRGVYKCSSVENGGIRLAKLPISKPSQFHITKDQNIFSIFFLNVYF